MQTHEHSHFTRPLTYNSSHLISLQHLSHCYSYPSHGPISRNCMQSAMALCHATTAGHGEMPRLCSQPATAPYHATSASHRTAPCHETLVSHTTSSCYVTSASDPAAHDVPPQPDIPRHHFTPLSFYPV